MNIDLKIIKIKNVWKVVPSVRTSKKAVYAAAGDTVTWSAVGTDAHFQFPMNIFTPANRAHLLVGGYTKSLKDGKLLKLKIKNNAKPGEVVYAVFCTPDNLFAEGSTPPKIIVR